MALGQPPFLIEDSHRLRDQFHTSDVNEASAAVMARLLERSGR